MFNVKWNKKLSYKKQEEIFRDLKSKKLSIDYFFTRELITIKTSDFLEYKEYFSSSIIITGLWKTQKDYRSNNCFKHIHAVVEGENTQIHFDHGNYLKNTMLVVPHFFIDVIPYGIWHLFILKKWYKF